MLGYFPPIRPGELFTGAFAAALAISGSESMWRNRERILGSRAAHFGFLFPNRADHLLSEIPAVANVTFDDVLDGSFFWAISPFVDARDREKLLASLSVSSAPLRSLFPKSKASGQRGFVRFCAACVEVDRQKKERPIWSVEPNLPGNTCCGIHGAYLQNANIVRDHRYFLAPAHYELMVGHAHACRAADTEVQIAHDLKWLLQQRGSFPVSRSSLVLTLHSLFVESPRYSKPGHMLNVELIKSDVAARVARHTYAADVEFLVGQRLCDTLAGNTRYSFRRFSILCQLVEKTTADLFRIAREETGRAARLETKITVRRAKHMASKSVGLSAAKRLIKQTRTQYPGLSRKELEIRHPAEYRKIRRQAPRWFEANLPPNQWLESRNWAKRDEDCLAKLQLTDWSQIDEFSCPRFSIDRAIRLAGCRCRMAQHVRRGRLPRSAKFLKRLLESSRERNVERLKGEITAALAANPKLSRSSLWMRFGHKATRVMKADRRWWRTYPPKKRKRKMSQYLWDAKDEKFATVLRNSGMPSLRSDRALPVGIATFLEQAGMKAHEATNVATGRLPRTAAVIAAKTRELSFPVKKWISRPLRLLMDHASHWLTAAKIRNT